MFKLKNILFVMLMLVCIPTMAAKKKNKKNADEQTMSWRYEVQNADIVSAKGSIVFLVYSYNKDVAIAAEQCKKNAIHAVLFKGIPDTFDGRVRGQKAMIQDAGGYDANASFFDSFFATGGEYMRFVSQTTDNTRKISKVDKKEYKVGVYTVVQVDALRKRMEQEGIIKGMTSIF